MGLNDFGGLARAARLERKQKVQAWIGNCILSVNLECTIDRGCCGYMHYHHHCLLVVAWNFCAKVCESGIVLSSACSCLETRLTQSLVVLLLFCRSHKSLTITVVQNQFIIIPILIAKYEFASVSFEAILARDGASLQGQEKEIKFFQKQRKQ